MRTRSRWVLRGGAAFYGKMAAGPDYGLHAAGWSKRTKGRVDKVLVEEECI